jgi:hypothetical protein
VANANTGPNGIAETAIFLIEKYGTNYQAQKIACNLCSGMALQIWTRPDMTLFQ